MEGQKVGEMDLKDEVFSAPFKEALVHQIVVSQQRNQRQGTASTKERSEVSGGGVKPWRQKGTGRARAGSIRSPLWKGGGTTFGPHPKDYANRIPKALRRGALKAILAEKLRGGQIFILRELSFPEPKTKRMKALIDSLGIHGSCLVVPLKSQREVCLSARNLPEVNVVPLNALSALEAFKAQNLLFTEEAIEELQSNLVK